MIVQCTIIKTLSYNVIVMIVLTGAVAHLSHNVLPGRSSLRVLEEKDYESSAFLKANFFGRFFNLHVIAREDLCICICICVFLFEFANLHICNLNRL